MNPLIPLALAAGGAYWYISRNAVPKAALPPGDTVSLGGRSWIVRGVTPTGLVGSTWVDVYAPAGSWGPHAELRVLRFTQAVAPGAPRILDGVGDGVPVAMRDAAMAAFQIKVPGAP